MWNLYNKPLKCIPASPEWCEPILTAHHMDATFPGSKLHTCPDWHTAIIRAHLLPARAKKTEQISSDRSGKKVAW